MGRDQHSAGAFRFDARFPGQWADPETGLFHNGFRDYDPAQGRYVQSDPIGLGGGWNTYGYVGAIPTTSIDLMGLSEKDYRQRIPKIMNNVMADMVSGGRRRQGVGHLNAYINNASSYFNKYEVCAGQADEMLKALREAQDDGVFDDEWIFLKNENYIHHWVVAIPTNQADEILRIDPWLGVLVEGQTEYGFPRSFMTIDVARIIQRSYRNERR